MDQFDSFEELPRQAENGLWIKGIRELTVVSDDAIDGRTDQLEHQALVNAVGAGLDKSVQQVENVLGREIVRSGNLLQLLEVLEFLRTVRSVRGFDLQGDPSVSPLEVIGVYSCGMGQKGICDAQIVMGKPDGGETSPREFVMYSVAVIFESITDTDGMISTKLVSRERLLGVENVAGVFKR